MKQLSIYTLSDLSTLNLLVSPEVKDLFEQHKFTPCTQMQKETMGFAPTSIDGEYISDVNGDLYLNIAVQQKRVNKNHVNHMFEEKEAEYLLEHPEIEVLPKTIKETFKSVASDKVLMDTYPETEKYFTVVFCKDGTVMVDGKGKKAEELLSLIRAAVGTLPVVPLTTDNPITDKMDTWVANSKELNKTLFTFGEKVTLVDPVGEKAVLSKCPVDESRAPEYVEKGSYVEELALNYDGVVDFNINADLVFSGIKFDKEFANDAESQGASMILQVNELKKLATYVIGMLTSEE